MIQYTVKIAVTALLITLISELAKKNGFVAALTAALPITSLIAILWLYYETGDVQKIADLSMGIFWLVIPSLLFFVCLALTLRQGMNFPLSIFVSSGSAVLFYFAYCKVIEKIGIQL